MFPKGSLLSAPATMTSLNGPFCRLYWTPVTGVGARQRAQRHQPRHETQIGVRFAGRNQLVHLAAKMGVLVHPNYSDELANGVAVSFDPIRGLDGYYYVNTQVGEDLVTNPEAHSIPEELLLRRDQGTYAVLSTSNLVESGELLMSDAQLIQLRDHLTVIHERFALLYNPAPDEPFAMEIEFKITSDNVLAIKQARPWVFKRASQTTTPNPDPDPDPPTPPTTGGGGGGTPSQPPPGVPRNLLVESGDGQVTLTWDAPEDDGGSAVTDYEYRIDRRNPWISIGSTDTTHTVTGLVNGTPYVFQVRALNRIGRSGPSLPAEATPIAQVVLDLAHFANGAGIISEVVLVNVAPHPIRPALYFYDQEGEPIAAESMVDVLGDLGIQEDGGLTIRTEMELLGELTISTHGRGDLVSGSVKVAAYGTIGGVLRFDLLGIGVAGVQVSQPLSDALFPVRRQEAGINTGVAVHNLGEEAMEVTCELMQGGTVLDDVSIPPCGQRAVVLVYQRGVHRCRYVRLRGVGALCRARGRDVHRSGRGAGCRQPHLHDAAGSAGPRENVSGVDEGPEKKRRGLVEPEDPFCLRCMGE